MTSDSNGDFSQASLALGVHSLTYSKSGYLGLTMKALLETDNETVGLETVRLLYDNCTTGTMSGKITDAVTSDNLSGVSLYYTIGLNKFSGFSYFDDTDTNGAWSLSKSAGWYTILAKKSGYYDDYYNSFACGDQPNQDNSLSSRLNEGAMRIMLKWPKTKPITGIDLDAHISIPNTAGNGTFHLYYADNTGGEGLGGDYYVYGAGDNVTLDWDDDNDTRPSPPGKETITITKVRSGTYSYSVHNFTDKDNAANKKTVLAQSRAKVKVLYNNEGTLVTKRFHVPNKSGTLWRVFTFDKDASFPFTRVKTMDNETTESNIY
jgi:hypothetical protein